METPIYNFIKRYNEKLSVRFHMPGHKGRAFLGCEAWDITEVSGADSLYEAEGIIFQSEKNAATLFGSGATFYSTEGSSQCIKAMLYLMLGKKEKNKKKRPYIIAGRNAHKAFLHGAALLDLDILWWYPRTRDSVCSCDLKAEDLEQLFLEQEEKPIGVYLTSPDYLGNMLEIDKIAKVCHKYDCYLAVDNAHGAYLHFLNPSLHPLDLGADLCCDSAHKTLPVLTGGAYLHVARGREEEFQGQEKTALSLFGSTSPSYLTLSSLDLCNTYLEDSYTQKLEEVIESINGVKDQIRQKGWNILETEPLKLTLRMKETEREKQENGLALAKQLEKMGIHTEYADPDYVVCMITPENGKEDLIKLEKSLEVIEREYKAEEIETITWQIQYHEQVLTVREASFLPREEISVEDSVGRVCALPTVSCPPAIPIVVSGERVCKEDLSLFHYYGIEKISVVCK